jgi:hypothetical protein
MKITEKELLNTLDGISKGTAYISKIGGEDIYWVYRTGRQSDGYNCHCSRDEASEITLEWSRMGTIDLDPECDDHSALATIERFEEELFGSEIADVC